MFSVLAAHLNVKSTVSTLHHHRTLDRIANSHAIAVLHCSASAHAAKLLLHLQALWHKAGSFVWCYVWTGHKMQTLRQSVQAHIKTRFREKRVLLRTRVPASQHTWQSKRYMIQHGVLRHQNLKSGATSIAQKNFVISVLLKIFSMGTSFLLHQATVMRGSR